MKVYEKLYSCKNNPKFIEKYLPDFLLFQIYSPLVLKAAHPKWEKLPEYIKENTPDKIKILIEKSPNFSDEHLQKKLNAYQIDNAIQVLKSYQNCGVPLTNDPSVKQTRRKLTSGKGDKHLKILEQAKQKEMYSDKIADLAVRCAHKFLFDDKNYRSWHISAKFAENMAQEHFGTQEYTFPAIQLTKGCPNYCSHCCDRAQTHLSHMPWPVFVNIYRGFHKHYKHYPQKTCDHYFCQFFADSDMLTYYDPVIHMDSGDVCLWLNGEKGLGNIMTRGVRDEKSKLALLKVIFSDQPIVISFVDTPRENMIKNQQQLSNTLDVVESIPGRKYDPTIVHLHMKSGPTVSDKIFRDFPVEKTGIWAIGRGKDLPENETEHHPDYTFWAPHLITPNGDVLFSRIINGENIKEKVNCLYGVRSHRRKKTFWKRLSSLLGYQR